MNKTKLFGAATLAEPEYMEALLGVVPDYTPYELKDHDLCVQTLEDMPVPAYNILKDIVPEGFRSYFLRRGNSTIKGKLWTLNDKQIEILDDWEFEGIWHARIPVVRVSGDLSPAVQIYLSNRGTVVDYKTVNPFPNGKEELLEKCRKNNLVARIARGEK